MANSITKVSDKCFRVLLDALAADGAVTIGFSESTADPAPDLFMNARDWQPYTRPNVVDLITLQDAIKVSKPTPVTDISVAVPISVVKDGDSHADFSITIHNDGAFEGQVSAALELYIEWAGH